MRTKLGSKVRVCRTIFAANGKPIGAQVSAAIYTVVAHRLLPGPQLTVITVSSDHIGEPWLQTTSWIHVTT